MGYVLNKDGFNAVLSQLNKQYRIYAPVIKEGEGRFTDVDVIRYDFVSEADDIELSKKSDFSFKELLTPLSQTLFFFTEDQVKEADMDQREVLIFLRSCDMHAVKRLDDMNLNNGLAIDTFYKRIRDKIHFVLIGCAQSYDDCFCVDMKSNITTDGYVFSIDQDNDTYAIDVKDSSLNSLFQAHGQEKEVQVKHVTENPVHVTIPESIPLDIYKDPLWDEYTLRCINCGRCNFVCPTCTCWTMQDIFYTDNGKVGERRRVQASCMVDGYTNVAGGGQYRRTNGERMRFKTLHKIHDYRKRFGYDMCVGCGRCDAVCPEYISFSTIINKVNKAVEGYDHE